MPSGKKDIVSEVVAQACQIHEGFETGDILCFLTGQEECLQACELFKSTKAHQKFPLYGRQDPESRKGIFDKSMERKIIFSTDVAESSITFDGVVFIIDAGKKKEMLYDARRKVSTLQEQMISKSSAIQRAGRAGRTAPGICYRLYSVQDFEELEENKTPEIFCKPLDSIVLTVKAMHLSLSELQLLSAPSIESIHASELVLRYLGALDDTCTLTELGRKISKFQHDPAVTRMIINSSQNSTAFEIAGILPFVGSMFWREKDAIKNIDMKKRRNELLGESGEGDIYTALLAFRLWKKVREGTDGGKEVGVQSYKNASAWCRLNGFSEKALNGADSLRRELLKEFKRAGFKSEETEIPFNSASANQMIYACLFLNVAVRVGNRDYCALLSGAVGCVDKHSSVSNTADCVFYQNILEVGITVITGCAKASLDSIKLESELFYNFALIKMQSLPTATIERKNISESIMKLLIGKNKIHIRNFEEKTKSSVSYNRQKGFIFVRCCPPDEMACEKLLQVYFEAAYRSIAAAADEEVYKGSTRMILGNGGICSELLHGKEFCSILVCGLDHRVSEDTILKIAEKYGNVRSVTLTKSSNSSYVFCKVTFLNKKNAKLALCALDGEFVGGSCIKVKPSEIQTPGLIRDITCCIRISFPVGIATGRVRLFFDSPLEMQRMLNQLALFPGATKKQIKEILPVNTESNSKAVSTTKKGYQTVLFLQNCNISWNEAHYFKTLTEAGIEVTDVRIERKVIIDEGLISVWAAEILNPLNAIESKIMSKTQFDDPAHQLGGFLVFIDIDPFECEVEFKACSLKYAEANIQRHGQVIQSQLDFTLDCAIHSKVFEIPSVKSQIDLTLSYARSQHVFVNVKRNSQDQVQVRFKSSELHRLERIKRMIAAATIPFLYFSKHQRVLFTRYGRGQMELFSTITYIHWDTKLMKIYIYGSTSEREEGVKLLDRCVAELIDQSNEMRYNLNRARVKEVDMHKIGEKIRAINGILSFEMLDTTYCLAVGSLSGIEFATQILRVEKLLFEVRDVCVEKLCYACGCDDEDAFHKLSLCGHGIHLDCATSIFISEPPYVCQFSVVDGKKCNSLIALEDIKLFCDAEKLSIVKGWSLFQFVKKNETDYFCCPKPGCNQIHPTVPKNETILYCDSCSENYCVVCSAYFLKPIVEHKGYSCQYIQTNQYLLTVDGLADELFTRILPCRCPRCQNPFMEYTGCAALTCLCKATFCALCLVDTGTDAHAHVRTCSKNPDKGNYFVTFPVFLGMHAEWRSLKTKEFFSNLSEKTLKKALLESIGKELDNMFVKRPILDS